MDGVTRRRAPAAPGGQPEGAGLRLMCLPAVEVLRDGRPVAGFRSVAERALLVYLAVEGGRPHDRAALAGLLWPDAPAEVARHNLSQTVLGLRTALGDRDPGDPADPAGGPRCCWPPARRCAGTPPRTPRSTWGRSWPTWTRWRRTRTPARRGWPAARPAWRACGRPRTPTGARSWTRSPGPPSELFEEWAALKREGLRRRVAGALEALAEAHLARGDRRRRRGTPGGSWRSSRWRRRPTGA